MKKLLFLFVWLIGGLSVSAGEVTQQEALLKAQRFMQGKQLMLNKQLNQSQTQIRRVPQKNAAAFYVFNVENEGGFVIVSGDDRTAEILGYSEHGSLTLDDAPENVKWWLSEYEREITYLLTSDNAIVAQPRKAADNQKIPALVKTQWDQTAPYHNQCPTIGGTRCYTGCVATAMAQIMKYHQWPATTGRGSHSYTWNGQTLSMNFSTTTFDWKNMLDTYTSSASTTAQNAVATLMYACGVSVNMDYGTNASGAYSGDAAVALRQYFDYDATYVSRDNYSAAEWNELVYNELAHQRPVFYSGSSTTGGHAFICDGYDANGYFHINWGWGGWCDGNFLLSNLDSQGDGNGYNSAQYIIYGIRPLDRVQVNGIYYGLPKDGSNEAVVVLPENEGYYTGDVIIPKAITYGSKTYTVTGVNNDVWNHCKDLTSLVVNPHIDTWNYRMSSETSPNLKTIKLLDVNQIEGWTFQNLTNLTTLEFGNNLESIGYAAFEGCAALTDLVIPDNVKSIGEFAFNGCNSLKTLKLGKNLESIGFAAFFGCDKLAELVIPDKVKSIGASAFSNCWQLATLKLGKDLESIGNSAFWGCIITELVIPNKVKSIEDQAFNYANKLTTLVLPNSLETIGYEAFNDGAYLRRTIISQITDPSDLPNNPFKEEAFTRDVLYVPNGTVEKYKSKEIWKNFAKIEVATVTVSVGADGLATYCPTLVGVDFSNSTNIAAYKAAVEDNTVNLTRVETVAAGEGVLLRSLNGGAATEALLMATEVTPSDDNAFVGTLESVVLDEFDGDFTNFVLSKNNGNVGFYKANNTKVSAGKAYLPVENYQASAEAGLRITFDDDMTGISNVETQVAKDDDAIYTLSGIRIDNPTQKGVYIRNGKKFIIK